MDILFICTHNRCRSILAEAICNHLSKAQCSSNTSLQQTPTTLRAYSAGSQPSGRVHPLSIKYLQQQGISTEGLKSQSWDDFENKAIDVAITVCDSAAAEQCPLWMGEGLKVHWGLPDPSKLEGDESKIRSAFFQVMGILQTRIEKLLATDINNMSQSELQAFLQQLADD